MDPRHKLYKQLDNLTVDPAKTMSARTDTEAAQTQSSSGVTPESIKTKLETALGATYVEIEDMSGRFGRLSALSLTIFRLPRLHITRCPGSWFCSVDI